MLCLSLFCKLLQNKIRQFSMSGFRNPLVMRYMVLVLLYSCGCSSIVSVNYLGSYVCGFYYNNYSCMFALYDLNDRIYDYIYPFIK